MRRLALVRLAVAAALLFLSPASAGAAPAPVPGTPVAAQVAVDERLDALLPLGVTLTDQDGQPRRLQSVFDGKRPVVFQFAYYRCPLLCDLTLRQLAQQLRTLDWVLGKDYRAVTVSIDPTDTPLAAGAKREKVLGLMKEDARRGVWPFFVAKPGVVDALTRAAGYHAVFDARTDQYAHPAVTLVATPAGKLARYLYGPVIDPQDLSLALREARAGRSGATALVDRTILSCFHYDPSTRRYGFVITGVLRGGALVVMLVLGAAIFIMARRGRARRARV